MNRMLPIKLWVVFSHERESHPIKKQPNPLAGFDFGEVVGRTPVAL
jgi:hypothetical protein